VKALRELKTNLRPAPIGNAMDNDNPTQKTKIFRTVNGEPARVCNECGAEMVVRTNRKTGERFLGCSRFPDCTFTEELPIDQQLRAAGAMKLPGMDE
jgi:ssDNA-binding Zn-finger/Zn-ribbon topoisomerase 1